MKFSFDYSNELSDALKKYETEIPKNWVIYSYDDINKCDSLKPLEAKQLLIFRQMFELSNCAAKVTGAYIEVSIDEVEVVGQIILQCTDYYMTKDEDDISREALMFALKHSDSVIIRNIDEKVEFNVINSDKQLTFKKCCDIMQKKRRQLKLCLR